MFKYKPNLVAESGVHPSLHLKCHHEIIYGKLSLKVQYPPLYERVIWDYKNGNIPLINRAVGILDWGNSFEGKNVYKQSISVTKQLYFSQLYS